MNSKRHILITADYPAVNAPVPQNLAYQPYEMWKMTQDGKAVSPSNLPDNNFYDGNEEKGFNISLGERRGVDMNDLWLAQMDARDKVRKARNESKKKSKNNE